MKDGLIIKKIYSKKTGKNYFAIESFEDYVTVWYIFADLSDERYTYKFIGTTLLLTCFEFEMF